MGSLLNVAILTVLVATIYGPVYRQLTVLGVFRKATCGARLAEQQSFHRIEDTMQCEDLHYYKPSHKIFTACEDSVLPRFKWFPPLENFEGPGDSTGSIHVIDPSTMKSIRLGFENFSGPLITHGIDVLEDPDRPNAVYIFVVNHLPNVDYYQVDVPVQDVPKARSQIELFHHVLGSNTVQHVRSILHSLIVTPNDVYAESPQSFYVTNDHFYRGGFKRQVEDLIPAAKWSNVVHIQLDSLDSGQAETGVDAKVALTGLQNNNGLGHGQLKEEILISNAIGGVMYRGRANPETRNVSILDEVHFESSIDNPSYFIDPYHTSSDDASGYVLAGLLRRIDLVKNRADPHGKDGVMVWYTRRNATKEGGIAEWETRLIFEDDGTNIRSSSTALLVPIEPKPEEMKKAWLFVTGFVSENVIAVEVVL
ncbi:hypothetical protein BDV28DRAFT_138133 [Aspergillus coremiiformis]|uniref:Serum paraoxonase/arylesterase family protein n=1 Tax=Aspergillus coremiiformis TaxID=138285 RepID=A0A5N6YZV4_9EURO|nr:hypothetical protein BDV28DRAFT_138133 [Aspergillus coremiiformis]